MSRSVSKHHVLPCSPRGPRGRKGGGGARSHAAGDLWQELPITNHPTVPPSNHPIVPYHPTHPTTPDHPTIQPSFGRSLLTSLKMVPTCT